MSILVKTTSGNFTMDDFLGNPVTALDVLTDVSAQWPDREWRWVRDGLTGETLPDEHVVPDGTTVLVETDQPVDA